MPLSYHSETGVSTMADDREKKPATFADRLNFLFATRLSPSGKPWTLQAISEATGGKIPVPYLSMVRKGKIATPAWDRVQILADIFGVTPRLFLRRASIAGEFSAERRGSRVAACPDQTEHPFHPPSRQRVRGAPTRSSAGTHGSGRQDHRSPGCCDMMLSAASRALAPSSEGGPDETGD